MTRGAGTTLAWVVPGALPGSGIPLASSVVSQQSLFSNFRGGRHSSGVFLDGRAEKTKVVGVPPGIGALHQSGGGTGCTSPYLTVRQNFSCYHPSPLLVETWCGLSGCFGPCGPRCLVAGRGLIPSNRF